MLPFIDLAAQQKKIRKKIDARIKTVLNHGAYIMGKEVVELETALAEFCGAKYALSCANGTDAIALILMAKGVKAGDAVFCPSFTFAATAEVVAWVGATPIFVDIDEETFNMDASSLKLAIQKAKSLNLTAKCVISVDLFGLPADYDKIEKVCEDNGLWLLSDSAQGFGGVYKGRKTGTIGEATSTSFFPAKPLGCYGDGGAVFTDSLEMLNILKSLRVHGQNLDDKYDNIRIGMNGRMDTLQAAILLEKLAIFPAEIKARNKIAKRYSDALKSVAITPKVPRGLTSIWAQYTLKVPANKRQTAINTLKAAGIPTMIYYPIPLHLQQAYKDYPVAGNRLAVTEKVCHEVLSLPMHPYIKPEVQDMIIAEVIKALS